MCDLPLVRASSTHDFDFIVDLVDDRLALVDCRKPRIRPVIIDLDQPWRATGVDLLRRAIGRQSSSVIDATAGFGRDAIHLARLGLEVTAIERCQPIALLLDDAILCARDEAASRIRLLPDDSLRCLEHHHADVVYVDPMFDASRGLKSLPRKAMQVARELAGDDVDARDLAAIARRHFKRVVVKRPDKSPPLVDGVHHSHCGNTVRYDVYLLDGPVENET
ncbi:MAG: hypothetical protein DHS20C01_03360 [marine bacterium B5-7]|nr:MAG: hypothetical protein DHS20C01_03360 [marine bacterium B5-7]